MTAKLLAKDKWSEFIGELARGNLWMPSGEGKGSRFVPVKEGEAPELPGGAPSPAVPPKSLAFPQTETLYRYRAGDTAMEARLPEQEMTLLGLRPCDARAMQVVEKLFRWEVDDPYYLRRRELATLIGLTCGEPGRNCFCSSVGGAPDASAGLDVLMTDLGEDGYCLEPVTPKGEALLAKLDGLLAEASPQHIGRREGIGRQALARIRRAVETEGVPAGLPGLWEDPLWQRIAATCLGCGACTFLCPTCHCFDIQDEVEGMEGRRYRCWDSCMFSEYTRHTSGHNPRPTRRERTRNRVNHKYNYFVQKFGEIACVGCGRCINFCPVNMDIIEILRQVKQAL